MTTEVIKRDVYVDHVAAGCNDITAALQLRDDLINLGFRGFELRKWTGNAVAILGGLLLLSQIFTSFDSKEPNQGSWV